jgi:hypothetical protein
MSQTTTKQEAFHIDEANRKKIIRQDRIPVEPHTCFLVFQNFKLELINISTFGCAVMVDQTTFEELTRFTNTQSVFHADFIFKNVLTQNVAFRLARTESHSKSVIGEMIVGLECVGEPLRLERIKAIEVSSEVIQKQIKYVTDSHRIPTEFKMFVYELKDWLEKLKINIDIIENEAPVDNWKENHEFKMTIADNVSDFLNQVIPQKYKELPVLLSPIPQEDLEIVTAFAREHLGHLIYGAPFANRAFYKPRGYAGDFEMMNHLYRDEMVGKSFYDQCLHKYFVDEPAGAAVKNRGQYLCEKITELFENTKSHTALKILSIASGPAMEQQMFLQSGQKFHGRKAEFTCLDQDEESLKHAQRQLHSLNRLLQSGFEYKFNNMAIRNVIAKGCPDTNYDLIYSAGLFDYFTEPVAQMAARKMLDSVKVGGKVIIGNFSKDNPSTPFMELILDWHLIYRSEEDLLRIFKDLGSKIWVEKEPLGINLFVVIEK